MTCWNGYHTKFWFATPHRGGNFVWSPSLPAADAALEHFCQAQLKRPLSTCHMYMVYCLMTSQWRKKLLKACCTFCFWYVPACFEIWYSKTRREPLTIAICLPLSKHRPWNLQSMHHVGELERSLCPVQQFHP